MYSIRCATRHSCTTSPPATSILTSNSPFQSTRWLQTTKPQSRLSTTPLCISSLMARVPTLKASSTMRLAYLTILQARSKLKQATSILDHRPQKCGSEQETHTCASLQSIVILPATTVGTSRRIPRQTPLAKQMATPQVARHSPSLVGASEAQLLTTLALLLMVSSAQLHQVVSKKSHV